MIELVSRAECYLQARGAWELAAAPAARSLGRAPTSSSSLRLGRVGRPGRPVLLHQERSAVGLAFAKRPDCDRVAAQGPATPRPRDPHQAAAAARPRRRRLRGGLPRLLRAATQAGGAARCSTPRRASSSTRSSACAPSAAALRGAASSPTSTATRSRSSSVPSSLESWQALPGGRDLRRRVLGPRAGEAARAERQRAAFAGEVALVTGAASGIGARLRGSVPAGGGAAVMRPRHRPRVAEAGRRLRVPAGSAATSRARATCVNAFDDTARGRSAGSTSSSSAPACSPRAGEVAELDAETWRTTFAVNLDANLELLRLAHPLARAGARRRPGRDRRLEERARARARAPRPTRPRRPRSTQLARVSALEWGADGIRVNVVHPNAVFDTGALDARTCSGSGPASTASRSTSYKTQQRPANRDQQR